MCVRIAPRPPRLTSPTRPDRTIAELRARADEVQIGCGTCRRMTVKKLHRRIAEQRAARRQFLNADTKAIPQ
jgi:hypothetical protein